MSSIDQRYIAVAARSGEEAQNEASGTCGASARRRLQLTNENKDQYLMSHDFNGL